MPTHVGESRGLGAAARAVSERLSSIVRLEIQLAVTELKRKVVALGLGIGLLLGAGLFAFFGLAFLLAAAAAAIALALPWWASLLIVGGGLFLLTGTLAFVGITALAKATPPVPEQAIEEARLTTEALKNGR
jgi:hypothetical protein